MSKKALITCIVLLCILLGGIAAAVGLLYSSPETGGSVRPADRSVVEARYPLFGAVPSDAAAVLHVSDMEDGLRLLTDSTRIFGSLVTESGKRGFDYFVYRLARLRKGGRLRSLGKAEMIVSLHYSGDLVPLMVLSVPKDTTADVRLLMAVADSSRMSFERSGTMLLISPARTLVASAARHLDSGVSIYDNEGFPGVVSATGGRDALYFSHAYASKLFGAWLNRPYTASSGFFSSTAEWSGFTIEELADDRLQMKVVASYDESSSWFPHTLAPGEVRAPAILPGSAFFAVDLPVADAARWTESWRKYLDAAKKIGRYKAGDAAFQKANGVSAEQWARRLDIKEVAKAVLPSEDGPVSLLFIRPGKADADLIFKDTGVASFKEYRPAVLPFVWKGYASLLFGSVFGIPDESMFTWTDGWMVIGDERTVSLYVREERGESLRDFLASGGAALRLPEKGVSLLTYVSMDAALAEAVFRPALAAAWKRTLEGIATKPAVLTLSTGTAGTLDVERVAARPRRGKAADGSAPVAAAIEVPRGPFKVRNSATGQDNLLSQADNMALQLRDEKGKTLWSIPFRTPLCGRVEEVDYYANGKVQFLFASGSRLYLIDRLGRMVTGFPAETGREIALGPAVYDFTGAGGYSALVLHKDNTVGMYDLHGNVRAGWTDISCEAAITALPELVTVEGTRYWVVRTTEAQPAVFGFHGGEPVAKGEAKKVLKAIK